jgi:putative MATE family efflux protein
LLLRLFSNKDLARLIFPLILEQFFALTLGFADIIMVASLGEAAVSGVSLVDQVSVLITNLFGALATGGAVVCAHYIGSRNHEMASRTAKQLIYSVTGTALIMTVLGLLFMARVISALFGQIEAGVWDSANTYFFYMLLSYPLVALYNAGAALFRAQGNSMVTMLTALLVNVINIGGNAVCIYVLKMGVEGVAIPTLLSRGLAAAILLFLLYRAKSYNGKPAVSIKGILRIKIDARIVKHILAIGVPNGIENSMFQIGKILVFSLMTTFGTSAIAANAAAGSLASFSTLGGGAIGMAMITVVGQCLGAKQPDEAVYFTKKLMGMIFVAMAVIGVPLLLAGHQLIALFRLTDETSALTWKMFLFHGIFALTVWPFSFQLPNALRAANDARFTMIVSFISMWTVRVGLSYVFAWYTDFGAMGIWYAMIIDWGVRSAAFIVRFARGKWRLHYQLDD